MTDVPERIWVSIMSDGSFGGTIRREPDRGGLLVEYRRPDLVTWSADLGVWLPIETAPKDAEVLLLVDGVVHQGEWQGESDGAIYSGTPSVYNWLSRSDGCSIYDGDIEGWMPLPALPNKESDGSSKSNLPIRTIR